jgi:hypothetical protein
MGCCLSCMKSCVDKMERNLDKNDEQNFRRHPAPFTQHTQQQSHNLDPVIEM